jgi:hypothetical protein
MKEAVRHGGDDVGKVIEFYKENLEPILDMEINAKSQAALRQQLTQRQLINTDAVYQQYRSGDPKALQGLDPISKSLVFAKFQANHHVVRDQKIIGEIGADIASAGVLEQLTNLIIKAKQFQKGLPATGNLADLPEDHPFWTQVDGMFREWRNKFGTFNPFQAAFEQQLGAQATAVAKRFGEQRPTDQDRLFFTRFIDLGKVTPEAIGELQKSLRQQFGVGAWQKVKSMPQPGPYTESLDRMQWSDIVDDAAAEGLDLTEYMIRLREQGIEVSF